MTSKMETDVLCVCAANGECSVYTASKEELLKLHITTPVIVLPGKYEVLELGRVKWSLHTANSLNGQKLSVVEKHKYLGVVISTKLSWSSHIDKAPMQG